MTPYTEADLEARIHSTLRDVFPWLSATDLSHQTTFTLRVGRNEIALDGIAQYAAGRSDILIQFRDRPLAVLELKRPGVRIDAEDIAQGRSYAMLLQPPAPLVVITNGKDTNLVVAYTGEPWQPGGNDPAVSSIDQLFASVAAVADADVQQAIETLLASGGYAWAKAIRAATRAELNEMSGPIPDMPSPFAASLLFPRRATHRVIDALHRRRMVVLDGPPMIGKSSVLRDLAERMQSSPDVALLYLDAQGSPGRGVLESLARLLRRELAWPASRDDVRNWVERLARRGGESPERPALVIAVDNPNLSNDGILGEVQELAELLGDGLKLVISTDEATAEGLVRVNQQRTRIGRIAERVKVEPLSDDEFEDAANVLRQNGFGLMPGADYSAELRTPWVLRTFAAAIGSTKRPAEYPDTAMPELDPMLTIQYIEALPGILEIDAPLEIALTALAKAVVSESQDKKRPPSLQLLALHTFVIRRSTATELILEEDRRHLLERGLIRLLQTSDGDAVYVIRAPEILIPPLTGELAREIAYRSATTDLRATANWLADLASTILFGDLIAAAAVVEDTRKHGQHTYDILQCLYDRPPREAPIKPGRYVVALGLGVSAQLDITADDLSSDIDFGGGSLIEDYHPWLVLSHLCGMPLASGDATTLQDLSNRIDASLLLDIGACRTALRRPPRDPRFRDLVIPMHELPDGSSVVCHDVGIVEPVTLSLLRFLAHLGKDADPWIDEAIQRNSPALILRLSTALQQLSRSADQDLSSWATSVLDQRLKPLYGATILHA